MASIQRTLKKLGRGPIIPSVTRYSNMGGRCGMVRGYESPVSSIRNRNSMWFNQDGTDTPPDSDANGGGMPQEDPNELVDTSTGMLQAGAAIVPPSIYDAVVNNQPLPGGVTVGIYTGVANKMSPPKYQIQFPNMNNPDGAPYYEMLGEDDIMVNFVVVSETDWVNQTDAYLAMGSVAPTDIDPGTPTGDEEVIVNDVVIEEGCSDSQFDVAGTCVDRVAILIGLALVGFWFFTESGRGQGPRMNTPLN